MNVDIMRTVFFIACVFGAFLVAFAVVTVLLGFDDNDDGSLL